MTLHYGRQMIFKVHRTKTKGRKEWWDATKSYRVVCVKEVAGVKVNPRYHALVKITLPGHVLWDFVDRHGTYKTQRKACEACDTHKKIWERALQAETKTQLLKALGRLPIGVPCWVAGIINPEFMQLMMQAAK